MACADMSEADLIGQQLEQLHSGYLVTYRRAEEIVRNTPAGKVALVILATQDSPAVLCRTLKWLRRRWPRCPITVVGDLGGGEMELAARKEAACYLTRPVDPEQWKALLSHALGQAAERQLDDGRRS
jgi:DNA-binding NtrC family response regulator